MFCNDDGSKNNFIYMGSRHAYDPIFGSNWQFTSYHILALLSSFDLHIICIYIW